MATTNLAYAKQLQSGLRTLTVQADALALQLGQNTTPPPVVVIPTNPPDTPPVVIPPTPAGKYNVPTGLSDPRFNKCVAHAAFRQASGTITDFVIDDTSGQPALGFGKIIAQRGIIRAREGVRVSSDGGLYQDLLILVHGEGDDHGDGVQFFGPGPTGSVTFERIRIEMQAGANNCGFFVADKANADVVINGMEIVGSANCPNGSIWMPNRKGDKALNSISLKGLRCDAVRNGIMGIDFDGGGARPIILAWEDNYVGGVKVERPY